MRIGVDVRELQQGVQTGIGRFLQAFLSETPRLRPGVELVLYGDSTTQPNPGGDGSRFRVLAHPLTLWFDQLALPKALEEDDVHVFFSPYYKAPLFAPCPVVITIHDVLFLRVGRRRLKHTLFKPWARIIASRTRAVLTDSEHSRHDVAGVLGVDPRRLVVVPLGVSDRFSPEARARSSDLRRRLGVPKKYVLSVTNFLPHKNALFLLRAFAGMREAAPDLALVLAGRAAGPTTEINAFVERHRLEDRVHLPGHITDEDLPALYAGAHLFAFPSLYEGFGLPVLEAMASGVPVVSSSASSLPEVTSDAALLVDPTDEDAWRAALDRVATDGVLRAQLVRAGLARARAFTWQESVQRILSVLEGAAAA